MDDVEEVHRYEIYRICTASNGFVRYKYRQFQGILGLLTSKRIAYLFTEGDYYYQLIASNDDYPYYELIEQKNDEKTRKINFIRGRRSGKCSTEFSNRIGPPPFHVWFTYYLDRPPIFDELEKLSKKEEHRQEAVEFIQFALRKLGEVRQDPEIKSALQILPSPISDEILQYYRTI